MFERMVRDKKLAVVGNTKYESAAGIGDSPLGRGREIRVGGLSVVNPIFDEASQHGLGLGFLMRFTVTFDFPKQTMYLRKGKRYDEPVRWDRSGLHLRHRGGKTVVSSVDAGSPAAESGVRADDVIVSVGDTAADKSTLFALQRQLITAERRVRLTVQRGDRRIDATVVLEPAPRGAKR